VLSGDDPARLKIPHVEKSNVIRSAVVHGKTQSQIEVTIKEGAIPAHAELVTAHQPLDGPAVKRCSKESKIILIFVLPGKLCSESSERHIGDGQEMSKDDPKAAGELPSVVLLKSRLGGWQKRSPGVVDDVQR
jgi:hypothetical protein